MLDEKGFTYPISLCMLVFFSIFLMIASEQLIMEKRFYKETETILVGEYYLLSALKETEEQLINEVLPNSGKFVYSKGAVAYQRKVLSETMDELTFTLKLDPSLQWVAIAQYDHEQQKMVKWTEWN